MAGKKDSAVVVVITDLTENQAGQIISSITKAKRQHAPKARASMAVGLKENLSNLIGSGMKAIGFKEDK